MARPVSEPAQVTAAQLRALVHPPSPIRYGQRRLERCHSIADLARAAHRRLPSAAWGYLEGGGEDEWTAHRNRRAFDELELYPRVLRDVHHIDTGTSVLGQALPLPLVLAPAGAPRLIHHEGELAVARAAAALGVPYGISTLATVPLADLATTGATLWFQLYAWGDRGVARDLIAEAQELGYRALIVDADVSVRSKRERELRAGLTYPSPRPTVRTLLDGALHPSWAWHFLTSPLPGFPNLPSPASVGEMFDGTLVWDDLEWLRTSWSGPIAVKGILTPADARRAADHGVSAVVVSNHGGRQLDHVPAAIDALPAVVAEVGDRVEVLFDSGIRRGTDILMALALGAKAVLIGRAYLYGLAAAGEAGVRHAVDLLADELRTAMALTGAASLAELTPDLVHRRS